VLKKKKKKIILIGSNPNDFLDCTLEAVDILRISYCVIISKKFDKKFFNFFKENSIKYILEESLSVKRGTHLWKKILDLFSIYKSLVHIISGDTFLFSNCKDEKKFFEKNHVLVERFPAIIEITNILNSQKIFLTNRKKNSSVTFLNKFNKKRIIDPLKSNKFEKLIFKVEKIKQIEDLISIISNNFQKRKLKLLIGKKIFNLDLVVLKKINERKILDNNIYVIIE